MKPLTIWWKIGFFIICLIVLGASHSTPVVYAAGIFDSTPPEPTPTNNPVDPVNFTDIPAVNAAVGQQVIAAQLQLGEDASGPPQANNVIVNNITLSNPTNFTLLATPNNFPVDLTAINPNKISVTVNCQSLTAGEFTTLVQVDTNNTTGRYFLYKVTCKVIAPVYNGTIAPVAAPSNVTVTNQTANGATVEIKPFDVDNNVARNKFTLTIKNDAAATATLTGTVGWDITPPTTNKIAIEGGPDATNGTTIPLNLAPQATQVFTIVCSPGGSTQAVSARLVITHNDPAITGNIIYTVQCTPQGTGTYEARNNGVLLNPGANINFGTQTIGTTATQPLQILNNSANGPLTVTLTETSKDYNIQGGTITGDQSQRTFNVAAANNVVITLECKPTKAGLLDPATLSVVHNQGGVDIAPPITYNLVCTGDALKGIYSSNPNFNPVPPSAAAEITFPTAVQVNNLAIDPLDPAKDTPCDFPPTLLNRPNRNTFPVTITNTGNGVLIVSGFTSTVPVGNSSYLSLDTTCDFTVEGLTGGTINPAANTNFNVVCAPSDDGTRTARLHVQYSDDNGVSFKEVTYDIQCTGQAADPIYTSVPAYVAPSTTINMGRGQVQTLTITNTGFSTLTLGAPTRTYITAQPTVRQINIGTLSSTNLGATQSATLQITCTDSGDPVTDVIAELTIPHNATGNPAKYRIVCQAATRPVFQATPVGGAVFTLTSGAALTTPLNITNAGPTGSGNLIVRSISQANFNITNGPATTYTVSPNTQQSIAPGGAVAYSLGCTTTANSVATLTISYNDGDPADKTVTYTVNCNIAPTVPLLRVGLSTAPTTPITSASLTSNIGVQTNITLTLTNIGGGTLVFSKPSAPSIGAEITPTSSPIGFATSAALVDLAAGASQNVGIVCTPTTSTASTATLSIYNNSNGVNTTTNITITCTGSSSSATSTAAADSTSTAAAGATATTIPAVSSNQVTPCSNNQALSLPLPQNASGEFLLVNCYVVSTAGTVNVSLQQVLTSTSASVTQASIATIQANAGLMSVWRMGSWFLVPSTYNAATQTYSFDAIAGTNIYVFFYGGITQPVGSQSGTFITSTTAGTGVVPGTTTGDVTDVLLDEDSPTLPLVLSTLAIALVLIIYASRRFNSRRKNAA